MKKSCLPLLIFGLGLASCTENFRSEKQISEYFVMYSVQTDDGQTVVAVRDIRDPNDMPFIAPQRGYTHIEFNNFCFFAQTYDKMYDLLDINGDLVKQGDSIETHEDYVIISDQEDSYCYPMYGTLCGPADTFEYYRNLGMIFASNDNGFGVYDSNTGKLLVDMKYQQIVFATDTLSEAFYLKDGKKVTRYDTEHNYFPVRSKDLSVMKEEALANGTPWPLIGCGIVLVNQLR